MLCTSGFIDDAMFTLYRHADTVAVTALQRCAQANAPAA